ncbi:MAG: phage holin family protein [Cytophagales bacterium]|nr:phage holin family protein [Bernardetiaceae bacterium]MDW8210221.1 phage holin family protein [Cytophagales bacterium]
MIETLIKYLEINLELVKLDVKEIAAKLIVDVVKLVFMGFLVSMGVVFLSIALSFWISQLTGSFIVGLSLVGAVYLLAAFIFMLVRRQLRPIFERIVAKYIPYNQKLIDELLNNEKAQS